MNRSNEFYALLAVEPEEKYPFGSCQYKSVAQGYNAAKKIGVENLGFLYEEEDFIQMMIMKSQHDKLFKDFKMEVLWSSVMVDAEEDYEAKWAYVNEVIYNGEPVKPEFHWEDVTVDDISELLACKHPDELLEYLANRSWDLWSVPLPLSNPDLVKMLSPDVDSGPMFNMMAWEDGYAQGITMAIYEYLWEAEINWNEWDT